MTSRRWLVALTVGAFLTFATNHVVNVTLPLYVVAMGGTALAVGAVSSLMNVASLVARVFAGHIVGARGARAAILMGAVLIIAAPAGLLGRVALLVPVVMQGLGFALVNTGHYAAMAQAATPERKGRLLGLAGMVMPASLAIFPLIASALLLRGSFDLVFSVALILALASIVAFLAGGRPMTFSPDAPPSVEPRGKWWKSPLGNGVPLRPLAGSAVVGMADGALISFLPVHAHEAGLTAGPFFTVFALGLILTQAVVGDVIDRTSPARVGAGGFVLLGASMLLIGMSPTLLGFVVAGIIAALGFGASQTAMLVAVVRSSRQDEGRGVAKSLGAFDGGRILGLLGLGGVAVAVGGYAVMFSFAGAIVVMSAWLAAGAGPSVRARHGGNL